MKKILFVITISLPSLLKAEGLDERINDQFILNLNWWESFVLSPVNVFGTSIPLVLVLLVLGATFFTIYFSVPEFVDLVWLSIQLEVNMMILIIMMERFHIFKLLWLYQGQ